MSHLSVSVFNSPGDNPSWSTYSLWLAAWEQLVKPNLDWCAANGFRIIGIGDDFLRTQSERDWLHTSLFAEQAVRGCLGVVAICDGE